MKEDKNLKLFKKKISANVIFVGILFLGLVFKGIYLYLYSQNHPYYDSVHFDSAVYANWVQLITQQGWLGEEIFYQAPFYPYFLSILLKVLPNKLLTIYVIQLTLGVCSIGLIYLIAKRIYSERAGLIAAGFSVAYAPLTFFETKVLPTVTGVFLGLLFVYLLTRAEQELKKIYWFGGAAALGLAIICRPNYVLVIPLLFLGLLIFHRKELGRIYIPLLILVLTSSVIIGKVTFRNFVVGQDFVPISANSGITFAQGNNPWARGSIVILPGFSGEIMNQRHEETRIAENVMGQELKPSEVNRFWFKWGLNFIRENPAQYLRLLLNKGTIFFNNSELGSNYLLSVDKAVTPWLKFAFIPFGLIMTFAIGGLVLLFRQRPPPLALVATFISSLLILLIFYVNSRYRMTLVPAAIIMAGGGLDYLLRKPDRAIVIWLLAAIVFFFSLPAFMPLNEAQLSRSHSAAWAHLGGAYKNKNDLERALWAYEIAIINDETNYKHYLETIPILGGLNKSEDEIMRYVQQTSAKIPSENYRHLIIAEAHYSLNNHDKSIEYIDKIVISASQDYKLYLHSGLLLGRIGKHSQARDTFAKGLEHNSENIDLQFNYALACHMSGDVEEAFKWTKRIIANAPHFQKARHLLKYMESQ